MKIPPRGCLETRQCLEAPHHCQSIRAFCIAQNRQSKMSSNALLVSTLERASFRFFAESVKTTQVKLYVCVLTISLQFRSLPWMDTFGISDNRVPTPPGKSWIFFFKIPGPGKSWKLKFKVLESP